MVGVFLGGWHEARKDVADEHLNSGTTELLGRIAGMDIDNGFVIDVVVGIMAAYLQEECLGIEESVVAKEGGTVVGSPAAC